MLHNKNRILPIIVALVLLTSCDLDLIPESELSDEVFWKTDDDFEQGTAYLYDVIKIAANNEENYPLFRDVLTDNAVSNPVSSIANGSYLPSSNIHSWDQDYKIIRAANNIIEKAEANQPESVARYIAESRFFRAIAYTDLLSRYGGVPLILKTLDIDSEELYTPRATREEVMQVIYSDLDYAAANLPANSDLNIGSEYGRVTQGAALTLKARTALREGTWNKFHNAGDSAGHLQLAKASALAVMQTAEYEVYVLEDSITDSYKQLFKRLGTGPENKEVIWAYPYGISRTVRTRTSNFAANTSQGALGVSKSLVDSYLCIDGLPIELSPLYEGRDSVSSEFVNRDLRLNGTVVKKGEFYLDKIPFIPSLIAPTGYPLNKYFDYDGNTIDPNLDMILMRYAEVLLTYAEATFELADAISDQDLDISINLLRDRAGVARLSNAFVAANGLDMQQEIRRERRTELSIEGFRYDDLLRWKTAEIELPMALLGVKLFADDYPGVEVSDYNLDPEGNIIVEPASKRTFDSAKHYLWPIPVEQLGLNPALEQNPGW